MMKITVNLTQSVMLVADYTRETWHWQELPPGKYLLEEVRNPTGLGKPWLAVAGTSMGQAKSQWKDLLNGQIGEDDLPESPGLCVSSV